MPLTFNAEPAAHELIVEIAERYNAKRVKNGFKPVDQMSLIMDITACHCNGCPLNLEALADPEQVDDYNLTHDLFGISQNINRDTGELENHFLPRAALPEGVE